MLKTLLYFFVILIVLFFSLVLLIRTPGTQKWITEKFTTYLIEKTGTHISIDRLFVTFSGNIWLEGLYIEDELRDTLLYSGSLELGIPFRPLFQKKVYIKSFDSKGLVLYIKKYPGGDYNFQFLINAFSSDEISTEPDNDLKPWQFFFPSLDLSDFRFSYLDIVQKIFFTGQLSKMNLHIQPINTQELQFHFNSIYIDDVVLDIVKGDVDNKLDVIAGQQTLTSGEGEYPVSIDLLHLQSIQLKYTDEGKSSIIRINVDEHESRDILYVPPQHGNTYFTLKSSSMQTSVLDFRMEVSEDVADSVDKNRLDHPVDFFDWLNVDLNLNNLSFYHQRLRLRENFVKSTSGALNFSDLDMKIDTLVIPSLSLKEKTLLMDVTALFLRDHSGAKIDRSSFSLKITDQNLHLHSLNAKAGNSSFRGNLMASFENLNQAMNEPKSIQFSLDMPHAYIVPLDFLYFKPELTKDTFLAPILHLPIQMAVRADGRYDDLKISHFKGKWNHSDQFDLRGRVVSISDSSKMSYHFDKVNLVVFRESMERFVNPDTTYLLPEIAELNGRIHGNLNHSEMNFILTIPHGHFQIEGEINDMQSYPSYIGTILVDHWDASYYLDSVAPELVSGEVFISGSGVDLQNLHIDAEMDFKEILHRGRSLAPFHLSAQIRGNQADLHVITDSELAKFQLMGKGRYDTLGYAFNGKINFTHLDLKGLHISEEEIKVFGELEVNVSGINNVAEGNFQLIGVNAIKDGKHYNLEKLQSQFTFNRDSTYLDFNSKLATGHFTSNMSIDNTVNAMWSYAKSFIFPESNDSLSTGKLIADLNIHIPETDFLKEVLLPGLESMDDVHLKVHFDQISKNMQMDLTLPHILYKGTEVSGMFTKFHSSHDSLSFNAGFDFINSGVVNIKSTHLSSHFLNNEFSGLFQVSDNETGYIVDIEYDLQYSQDTFYLSLNPDRIIINNDVWAIAPNNRLVVTKDYLEVSHFELSNGNNSFVVRGHPLGKNDFLRIDFNGISLEGLLSVINSDEVLGRGKVEGFVELDNIFDQLNIKSSVNINDLHYKDELLGNLKAEIANSNPEEYEMNFTISGGSLHLTASGSYKSGDNGDALYQAEIDLSNFEFNLLESFTDGAIRSGKGLVHGKIKLDNASGEFGHDGFLHFDNVGFILSQSGTSYSIPAEYIRFSQNSVQFDNFIINDRDNNPTTITGEIGLESIINPKLDLTVKSQNFTMIESTKEDNDLVFGKAIVDFDLKISGYAKRPFIKGDVKLKRGSDITLILPEYESEVRDRAGVVVIEKRVDGKVVEEQVSDESSFLFIGVDVQSIIKIEQEALFRIVIDEVAGDQIEVAGEANLSFDSDALGKMSLSGSYELNKGFYEMRLYDIVSRRFQLQQGSKLVWSGDILEADMEVKATYRVRTSALDLMADQLVGADEFLRNQYRQELPFDVILHMKGDMMQPQIEFELDMPENSRFEFGGNVYNRIKQLNTMESELNTQVFSLLVLGRFLPQGMETDETRGLNMSGMMRSSASRMLSGQLNALSDKYISAVDLDFDLESFTDYQTGVPQDRTQLNLRLRRSLINERLTVQLGGQIDIEGSNDSERQNATNMLGDVSIEWRLVDDGSWGIRGFRRNQFESLVEGQVIATGISLLFNRNFNSFTELFTRRKAKAVQDSTSKKQIEQ